MPTEFKNDVDSTDMTTALASGAIADGDSMLFYRYDTDYLTNGDAHVSKNLLNVTLTKGFSGNFDQEPLVVVANQATSKVRIASASRVVRLAANAGTLKEVILDPAGNLLLDLNSAIVPTFRGYGGELYAGSSLNLTTANLLKNARARLLYSANAITTLNVGGNAFAELQRDLTTGNVYGGQLRINHVAVTPGTLNVFGGLVQWLAAGASGGTLNAGATSVLDFSQLESDIAFAGGTIDHSVIIRKPKNGSTLDLSACTYVGGDPDFQ